MTRLHQCPYTRPMKTSHSAGFLFGLYLFCSPGLVFSGGLLEIYQLAAKNDPQLMAANASLLAVREEKPQSIAQLLPTISASGDRTENKQDIRSVGQTFVPPTKESFDSHGYSLNLTQPVFRYDLFVGLGQANSRIAQAEADYRVAQQDLIVRVAERYFDELASIDNLEFARAEKQAVARQLDQAKQRFDVGLIAITDVHEAQAAYDLTVAQEIVAENLLANSREALQEFTGPYQENLQIVSRDIPLITPEPVDINKWAATAEQNNVQIKSAYQAAEVARKEVQKQRAGHFPTLDIVASKSNAKSNAQFGTIADRESIGLELNVPIFQGGLINSRTRQAQYRYEEAKHTLEQQKRAVNRQTRDAYLGVIAGISRVKALKQAVLSNQKALDATNAGFEVGTRTIVDVLLGQRELFRAKQNYARSRYDYILNTLRLKQASGTLTVADIESINRWLE